MAKKPKKFKRRDINPDKGEIRHKGIGLGTDYGGGLLSEEEIDKVIRTNAAGAFRHVRENLDKDPDYYNKKYASQNKKYGGGVYPRKTVGSDD